MEYYAGGAGDEWTLAENRRAFDRWVVHVFVALALGAAAVLLGRPIAWGLAARGEDGVVEVLEILRGELDNVMALAGCNRIADITRAHVARAE